MTLYLMPRGEPDTFCAWSDSKPRAIMLESETAEAWIGKPLSNPACPTLTWPKFAWIAWEPGFIRLQTASEHKSNAKHRAAMAHYSSLAPDGYSVGYMPYGPAGRGYYYVPKAN